jgi:transcription elongation factor GreB
MASRNAITSAVIWASKRRADIANCMGQDSIDNTHLITPWGYAAVGAEHARLFGVERPKIVEVIHWAAGNGDRSENGDYIYGRKRLREIDRELGRLSRILKSARVVDPAIAPDKSRVWFGATVDLANADNQRQKITLVGRDEADAHAGKISWIAPIAIALRGAAVGDVRTVRLPSGTKDWEVLAIRYPEPL